MVNYKLFMENNDKRRLKTPAQVEGLERLYAEHKYPSEAMKTKLAVELMLSKEQVHKWFCHRRQKEKNRKRDDTGMTSKSSTNGEKKDGNKKVKCLRLSSLREGKTQRLSKIMDYPNAIENTYMGISSSQERSTLQNGSTCEIESTRGQFQRGNHIPMVSDKLLRKRKNPYRIESKRVKSRALDLAIEQNNTQEDGDNEDDTAVKTRLCRKFHEGGPLISFKFDPLPAGAFDVPIERCLEDVPISWDLPRMPRKRNVQEKGKMGRGCHVSDPHVMQLDIDTFDETPVPNFATINSQSGHKKISLGRSGGKGKALLAPRSGGMGKALFAPRSGGMGKAILPPISGWMGKALLPPRYSSLTAEVGNVSMEVDISGLNNIDDLYTNVGAYQGDTDANQVTPDEGQSHLLSLQADEKFQPKDKTKRRIHWEEKQLRKNQICPMKVNRSSILKGRKVRACGKQRDGTKWNSVAKKGKGKKKSKKPVNLVDDECLELLPLGAEIGEIGTAYAEYDEGLLARFPPTTLRMKKPFMAHPWMDSKENVKNLFTVFRFLYTFADVINLCSFTLDEFVQAFHDHDSMLLGQIHIALLKLLLEDTEYELKSFKITKQSRKKDAAVNDCGFLRLIQSVKCRDFDVKVWQKFLNPLTWPEILRQVALEAGFGPKEKKELHNRIVSKEESQIGAHGLVPGTLKHALFHALLREGTTGLKVSEMAKHVQNCDLNDISSSKGLEALICSTLSSDITLFERISSSAFRLRANLILSRGIEQYHSCSESSDVESDSEESDSEQSDKDEIAESGYEDRDIPNTTECEREVVNYTGTQANLCSMELINQPEVLEDERNKGEGDDRPCDVGTEIDESHVGEAWLSGLIRGEYEELSVEERLNALVALVNLVKSGISVRRTVKNPSGTKSQFFLQVEPQRIGSRNGRTKTAAPKKPSLVDPPTDPLRKCKKDRLRKLSDLSEQKSLSNALQGIGQYARESFSLQCICLGSDRRYNTYWQFIRSSHLQDPGCGRVYFESSQDGHWEVIDNEEALETFMSLLDSRSIREANLLTSLRSREALLRQEMQKSGVHRNQDISGNGLERHEREIMSCDSSSMASIIENNQNSMVSEPENDSSNVPGAISLEFGRTEMEKQREWDRYRAFDRWVWSGFFQTLNVLKYNPELLVSCESCHDLYWPEEGHCKLCHTTFELDFDSEERYAIHVKKCKINVQNECIHRHKVLSSRLQSLKAAMQAVEAVLPEEALEVSWKKSGLKVWIKRLRRASSPSVLAQVLEDLENAIHDDWLHSCSLSLQSKSICREMIPFFQGTPHTIASMTFWLVRLDAIIFANQEKIRTKDTHQRRQRSKGASMFLRKCAIS